jgi:hypothetical protein
MFRISWKKSGTPVLLDNLEILFEKKLRQDTLRLLLGISRNHLIAASWNATAEDKKLTYEGPGQSKNCSGRIRAHGTKPAKAAEVDPPGRRNRH